MTQMFLFQPELVTVTTQMNSCRAAQFALTSICWFHPGSLQNFTGGFYAEINSSALLDQSGNACPLHLGNRVRTASSETRRTFKKYGLSLVMNTSRPCSLVRARQNIFCI